MENFDQKILEIKRVTRVVAGGKRMRFRAALILGDKRGRVGLGVAKANDVAKAIEKAKVQAEKNLIDVPIVNGTISYPIEKKFKASRVLLKPALIGRGIKAGGPIRTIIELAGIKNISSKILGSRNKINNVKATLLALEELRDL